MLRIGLTGGIGAGKSAVARHLRALGALVIDSDVLAREVVEPGTPGLAAVVAEFGEQMLSPDGRLDRARLGAVVFGDEAALARLNAIVHPLVGARSAGLLAAAPADAVVVHDIPLLVENGLAPSFHLVVVVEAPVDLRIERLVATRGMTVEAVRARMAAQATDSQRRAVADVSLVNDRDLDALYAQVDEVWTRRLAPYAANLAAGRAASAAARAVPNEARSTARHALAESRLRARLGEGVDLTRAAGDLVATVPAGVGLAGAAAALVGTGWIQGSGGDQSTGLRFDHADPCEPARLWLRAAEGA